MKRQQIVLIGSGVALFCLIFFFGKTVPPRKNTGQAQGPVQQGVINGASVIAASRQQLTASQQAFVSQLETAVVRGDVKEQQIKVYRQLASFWRDSAHMLLPYAWYSGEAAKLENSQKSLTFAAQFFLEGVRRQEDTDLKKWMASEAKELFERALRLDPGNDSLKVGMGSCYLFGNISETPMEGINMIREVANRNPENMYAQFMLGMGAMVSGQLDKAIERLSKVAEHEPDNLEAILMLADAYERKGDKANAIKWYEAGKKQIRDEVVVKEINERISLLKK